MYSFIVNKTNTGLPSDGPHYWWYVNNSLVDITTVSDPPMNYLFEKANTKYTVSLEIQIRARVIRTNSVTVTTGDVINPTLTATQDGANPLAYTITADESATNIGFESYSTSRVWSIDGKVVDGASTNRLHYTFGLTDHKYTVKYVVSKAGYDSREVTTEITTPPKQRLSQQ